MKEIDPKLTSREMAFRLWMKAPMPMVTFFKNLDITPLVRYSKKHQMKLNMLLCFCIGEAASRVDEFKYLPVGNKLMAYDSLAVSTIILNNEGTINSCDIPFSEDLFHFNADYLQLTGRAVETCSNHNLVEYMVIGTSALVQYELDGVVGMYSGLYNNPFISWSKYQKHGFKKKLMVSFQFHHVQMDGAQACKFLRDFQYAINSFGT